MPRAQEMLKVRCSHRLLGLGTSETDRSDATPVPGLDFTAVLTLEFEPPDVGRFPLLRLAREAGERGGTYPCAFNAANEVVVAAFLERRIGFLDIAQLVEDALAGVEGASARDLPELVEADQARCLAEGRLAPA